MIHVEEKVDGRTEKKVVRVPTVLLDSVQSQANRMELALLQGYREGKLKFPLIEVDFSGCVGDGTLANDLTDLVEINSLTVPHRIADAILRDSIVTIKDGDETKDQFSKSDYAKKWGAARAQNATALFELCPTALIFGMWGSPEKPGGLGAKFARALVSEIVGFDVEPGKRPSSRIDPLGIERAAGPVFRTTDGGWTIDPNSKDVLKENGSPVLFAKDAKGKNVIWKKDTEQEQGTPSKINHGNIPPSLKKENSTEPNPGGFTISYALQTTVLSLPALRRLGFPLPRKDAESDDDFKKRKAANQTVANEAARVVLAALALSAVAWNQKTGYDLRSGCQLNPQEATTEIEQVQPGSTKPFTLSADQAADLLRDAIQAATNIGLPWPTEPIKLTPSPNPQALIRKSRTKIASAPVAE